ncbi:hypothetical protein CHS0354_000750 [Potamilus streckersoni]|uniref:Lipoprotein LPP20-like domain-containing protein n=1 Tax=Potamilus streckersoni TaxID=2493646 RepID=A0AAE0W8K3_9BIVA|nr:hypothetical protein CHS0354_000750 [Potamilus streckersoni]
MSKYSYKTKGIQTDTEEASTNEVKVPSMKAKNNSFMSVPGWFASPPIDASYIYGVSSQISADLQIAINKAAASARADIGRQVKVKILAIQKRYTEDASAEEKSEISSLFIEVEKTIVNISLSGSRVREQSFSKEGRNWRAYVLVEYPVADIEMSLMQQAQKSNNQSFLKRQFDETRKRASKAFQELDDAVSEKSVVEVSPSTVALPTPEVVDSAKLSIQQEADLPSTSTEEVPSVILPPSDKTFDKEPVSVAVRESEKLERKTKGIRFDKKSKRSGKMEDDFSFLETQPKPTNSLYFGYYSSKKFNSSGALAHYGYVGYEKSFSDNRFDFLTELYLGTSKGVTSTKDLSLMTLIGLRWNVIVTNNWQLGLTGKVGFNVNFNVKRRVSSYDRYAHLNIEKNQSEDFASSVPILENSRKGKKSSGNLYHSDDETEKDDKSTSTSYTYDDDYYYYYSYNKSSNLEDKEVGFIGQLGLTTKFRFTDSKHMKKLFLLLLLVLVSTGSLLAQDAASDKMKDGEMGMQENATESSPEMIQRVRRWSIFGAFSGMPGKASGFGNVDISDKSLFPSAEGRISLPLKDANTDAFVNYGANIGFEYSFSQLIGIVVDLRFGLASNGKMVFASGMVGPRFKFQFLSNILELGISPKVGAAVGAIDFGKTYIKTGYKPPVYVNSNRNEAIYDGDKARTNVIGFAVQGTVDLRVYAGSSGLFVYAEAGWMQSFIPTGASSVSFEFSKDQNTSDVARAKLTGDSKYIVDEGTDKLAKDGSLKDAAISLSGLVFSVGVGFSF